MNHYLTRISQLENENRELRKTIVHLSQHKRLKKYNGNVNMIFEVIYEITGFDKNQFIKHDKPSELSLVRQLAIFMIYKYGNLNQIDISRLFCRHHSSIIYTLKRVNSWQTYPFSYPVEIQLFNVVEECIKKQIERNDEL